MKATLISIGILLLAIAGMAVKILTRKDGHFTSMHISDSKAMRDQGIRCNVSQDREARRQNPNKINVKDL